MRYFFIPLFLFLYNESKIECRPPNKHQVSSPENVSSVNGTEWDLGIEYNRYLQEVVQVLESDSEFRKKLEVADMEKIRDGSIAEELQFVSHHIRSQLDDIKRRELERLRHYSLRQFELNDGIDRKHIKSSEHLNLDSLNFEIGDLKKLIMSTTKDLEEADKKRKEEFKSYEMEKKFEHDERLKHIENENEREKERKRLESIDERHKDHQKLNHPMTKEQLEEVWEKQDHMRPEDWDSKTFFAMHDLNGDQHWDENELKILFQKELDKAYDPSNSDDDIREREEEMEQMREHVFKESDKNGDRLISWSEFLKETEREEFKNDPGWDTIDDRTQQIYSEDEFRAFEIQRQREIQDMINRGVVPPGYPYYGDIPQGAHPYPYPGSHSNQFLNGDIPEHQQIPSHHIPQQQFPQVPYQQQGAHQQHQQFEQPPLRQQQFPQQPPVPQQQQQFVPPQQPPIKQQQQQFAPPQQPPVQQQQFSQQPQQQFAQQPQQQPQQQFAQQPPPVQQQQQLNVAQPSSPPQPQSQQQNTQYNPKPLDVDDNLGKLNSKGEPSLRSQDDSKIP